MSRNIAVILFFDWPKLSLTNAVFALKCLQQFRFQALLLGLASNQQLKPFTLLLDGVCDRWVSIVFSKLCVLWLLGFILHFAYCRNSLWSCSISLFLSLSFLSWSCCFSKSSQAFGFTHLRSDCLPPFHNKHDWNIFCREMGLKNSVLGRLGGEEGGGKN